MKTLILIFIIIYFSGCSHTSPYRQVKPSEIIQNKYTSVEAPSVKWVITKEYKDFYSADVGLPNIYKSINGSRYTIDIQTYPFNWMPIDILFDKDGNYDNGRHVSFDDDKEKNINYRVLYTMYPQNLKCIGKVYSQNFGGTLYSATSKNYSITCGYYDKTEAENDGKRLLLIDYKYNYTNDKSRLQKDSNLKRDELVTAKQAEDGLKQAVKELVKTIKIKNFDRERMQKEGLMHYDKEFESTKW